MPTNYDLRTALVFCYHLKKAAAESHRMLVDVYGGHALGKTQCFEWFKKFKSGNFDVRNEDCGKPPKMFEDWDQKGVIYYELLKPGETVNANRCQQQMIDLNRALQEKRPDYRRRQHKVIFLHDNAPSHTAKRVRETIETFSWEILAHAAYSPDLAPSDYHLFASLGHALAEQPFTWYENLQEWLDNWFDFKDEQFYCRGIHHLLERWEKYVNSNGDYFE